jgi:hypothetical protein
MTKQNGIPHLTAAGALEAVKINGETLHRGRTHR